MCANDLPVCTFKNKIIIYYIIHVVANSSIKPGGSLHYTHFYNHICILLVLFVLLIKYQNHFESHDARRKDFRNKVLNPVHDWFLKGHHGKWYFPSVTQRCAVP